MTSPIANVDVEAELSYAFLHAVAAQAKASCTVASRLSDNRGIDAQLTSWGPFAQGDRVEVDLKVQLKATIAEPTDHGTHLSYTLKKIEQYNDLRAKNAYAAPRILVVLFLPNSSTKWMTSTTKQLAIRRAAYWVSFVGAEAVSTSSVTVHVPKANLLTPNALRALFKDLSKGKVPQYKPMGAAK